MSTGIAATMEAFGRLNGITAAFALLEQADPALQARDLAYLGQALASGGHPRLTALLSRQAQLHPRGNSPTVIGHHRPRPDRAARLRTAW
jgi:hypothetical protein